MRRVRGIWSGNLFAACALLIGLIACGGSKGGSALDTKTILESTAKRLDAVKSVRFDVAIDGAAYIDTARTTQLRSANGDIVPPDQMQTKLKAAVATLNLDLSLVAIGNDRYMTDPLTGRWGPAQPGFDYSPTVLFDKQQGLGSVLGKLRDVEQVGTEKVGGADAYHLRGKADRATIEPLTSGAIDGDPIAVDFWVAQGSFNLLKLVLTEPQTPDKPKPTVWTLTFDKYDQPVTIARPQ